MVGRRATADLGRHRARFDSALLSASADGTDAFFFTRDVLAPEEDRNGTLIEDLRRPRRRWLLQAAGRGALRGLR